MIDDEQEKKPENTQNDDWVTAEMSKAEKQASPAPEEKAPDPEPEPLPSTLVMDKLEKPEPDPEPEPLPSTLMMDKVDAPEPAEPAGVKGKISDSSAEYAANEGFKTAAMPAASPAAAVPTPTPAFTENTTPPKGGMSVPVIVGVVALVLLCLCVVVAGAGFVLLGIGAS